MIKKLIQHLVVKTNFWPLAPLYRACYTLALNKIVKALKNQKDILAAYLISSMAAGDYIPGLSDIDLMIIVNDSQGAKEKVKACYMEISRSIPFLKGDEQNIFTLKEIKCLYDQSSFYHKYKFFTECKKQGKILFGTNVLTEFKELEGLKRNEFILGQLAFNWGGFLKKFLIDHAFSSTLFQNYSCYKYSSDFCKAFISARDGKETFSRKKALEIATNSFSPAYQEHLARLRTSAQRRFFDLSPHIIEDSYDFCIKAMKETLALLPSFPETLEDRHEYQGSMYDFKTLGFILSDANSRSIDFFVNEAKSKYKEYIKSVLVSPVDLFDLEEENIGIFLVPLKHIPFNVIKDIIVSLKIEQSPQHLYLYIILDDIAIALNGLELVKAQTALFSLRWASPTLLYLATTNSVLFGEPIAYESKKKLVKDYFWEDNAESIARGMDLISKYLNDPLLRRFSNVKFQLIFWQAIRLLLIKESIHSGNIFLPLSSKQVYLRCKNVKTLNFSWLEQFHTEYIKDLNGFPSDTEKYYSQALDLLKENGFG